MNCTYCNTPPAPDTIWTHGKPFCSQECAGAFLADDAKEPKTRPTKDEWVEAICSLNEHEAAYALAHAAAKTAERELDEVRDDVEKLMRRAGMDLSSALTEGRPDGPATGAFLRALAGIVQTLCAKGVDP